MRSKQLLKFYFSADKLNRALDNLITQNALSSADYHFDAEYYAERICAIIGCKKQLSMLWRYLDGVISAFSAREKKVLAFYGALRGGITALPADVKKEIKKVTVKFTRHARNIAAYADGVKLVGGYYCLL